FFFSSRRRHTRFSRDWSSDVCSSDLEVLNQHGYAAYIVGGAVRDLIAGLKPTDFDVATNATPEQIRPLFRRARIIGRRFQLVHEIGRASCRERGEGRWREEAASKQEA